MYLYLFFWFQFQTNLFAIYPILNNSAMVWHRTSDKPSSEAMLAEFAIAYMIHPALVCSQIASRPGTVHFNTI